MSTSQLAGEALLRRVCASNAARRVFICYVSLMGLNKWLGGSNPCSVFFFSQELKVRGKCWELGLSFSHGLFFHLTHQFIDTAFPL